MAEVTRVAVTDEPLVPGAHDYADAFEVRLASPDTHTAEEWLRAGLEGSGTAVRALIRFVHRRVLRFDLSTEPGSVLGWEVVSSTPDVMHLRTGGRLLEAHLVGRRAAPDATQLTTLLCYRSRVTPTLWSVIGRLHRRIAPYLLARAARTLTR